MERYTLLWTLDRLQFPVNQVGGRLELWEVLHFNHFRNGIIQVEVCFLPRTNKRSIMLFSAQETLFV